MGSHPLIPHETWILNPSSCPGASRSSRHPCGLPGHQPQAGLLCRVCRGAQIQWQRGQWEPQVGVGRARRVTRLPGMSFAVWDVSCKGSSCEIHRIAHLSEHADRSQRRNYLRRRDSGLGLGEVLGGGGLKNLNLEGTLFASLSGYQVIRVRCTPFSRHAPASVIWSQI